MKALTIRQPWASLTLTLDDKGKAFKCVETRGYRTNYRGRLAIHAGLFVEPTFFLGVPEEEWRHFKAAGLGTDAAIVDLPHGVIVGEVTVADCVPIEELLSSEYGTDREKAFGDWRKGRKRYGWILTDPVRYDTPIPARGMQGIWDWEGSR